MKKSAISLFLVLLLVFSLVGCGTTASEETSTTTEPVTLSYEEEVAEVVQWTMVNIINKNSATRYASAHLYEDAKEEIESYISSLPNNLAPASFSIELISSDVFEIKIIF